MNIRIKNLLSPILVLGCVLCMVSAQLSPQFPPGQGFPPHQPVHSLCNHVRCGFGHVCRVVQECHFCAPHPACVPCVPPRVDAVCHRHHFLEAVLTGDRLTHTQLVARRCNPFSFGDCPFDSHCVSDGLGHGVCCYNKSPFGGPWDITSHHPQCVVNRCLPFCPFGETCQRVTICPFGGACHEELQCQPSFGGGFGLAVGAALGLGNE